MPAITLAALLGFTGVVLGALGAHGPVHEILSRHAALAIWQTAVFYHLVHAVGSLWAAERRPVTAWFWAAGILFFSGSLYTLALTEIRWLGAVTPVGGLLFLIGWALVLKPQRPPKKG